METQINIKELENKIDDFDSSCLKLEFSGNDAIYSIINSLRKVCIDQIPIYGFHISKINILRNNSVFDNSYMKERLSQLPIKNIDHDIKFLPLKYYKDVNFADNKFIKYIDDIWDIDLYFKKKNNGSDKLINVTTNDLRISINDKIIENSKIYSEKNPILLIQLRVGEEFECTMKGVLAIGEFQAIFNSSNVYYEEITPNKYIFNIESSGQLKEYDILTKGCEIIIEKLLLIKENVMSTEYENYKMITTELNSLMLEMFNEDYTCGAPINYFLQNMDEVVYAGITKPDFMQKVILIKFKVKPIFKPIDILIKAIDRSVNLFENIKIKFNKLNNK